MALQGYRRAATGPRTRRAHVVRPRAALAAVKPAQQQLEIAAAKKSRLITAVKTPYLLNGKFDLVAYDQHLEQQIAHGVDGVIVAAPRGRGTSCRGTSTSCSSPTPSTRSATASSSSATPGSNSTGEALHATEQGFAVGMHAALQINPYYGKTSPAGLRAHFAAVLSEGPAIVYNVPGRTGQDIPDDVILELAQHPNFLGVKECTGNARIANYTRQGVLCWSGNDDEAHDARHEAGGNGVISVASNLLPGLFSRLMASPDPQLNASLQELIKWLFSEPNPIALNTAFMMCGLAQPVFRLPYVPLGRAERERGAELLRAVREHIPGCEQVRVMEDEEFKLVGRPR